MLLLVHFYLLSDAKNRDKYWQFCSLSQSSINLVVGYTGAKKGSCFKFLRVPAYLMQYDLLSILTPFFFIEISQKNETVPSKKLNWMRGVCGGS